MSAAGNPWFSWAWPSVSSSPSDALDRDMQSPQALASRGGGSERNPFQSSTRATSGSSAGARTTSHTEVRRAQAGHTSKQALSGPREFVAEDSKTGHKTHWHMSARHQYTDPETSQKRSVRLKHIRKGKDDSARNPGGKNTSDTVSGKPGRAIGKIIEVRVVMPPPTTGSSAFSAMTGRESDLVRMRRFAVVQERPDGRDCFRAIAIKTYNGEGVSQQIKFHHSQIYAGKGVPEIRRDENPGIRNGQMERPMQAQPIRVEPYDRERSLDPMSRLDYCDRSDFDYGDPQVLLFGRVHADSESALLTQYWNVMNAVAAAVRGPTVRPHTAVPPAGQGQQSRATASSGPSARSGAIGSSNTPAAPRRTVTGSTPTVASSETVSVQQIVARLRELKAFADENDLTWPAQFSRGGLERMAGDRQLRETTLRRIIARLKAQYEERGDRNESSDEERGAVIR